VTAVAEKTIPSKFPAHPDGVEDALMVVLMCLPNQKARFFVSDLLVGYDKATSRHFRWLVDQIDAADPEQLEHFAPNFELHHAKEVLEKHASSPGTGVEPTVDGFVERKAPKRIRVQEPKRVVIPKPKKIVFKRGTKVRVR